MGRKLPICYLVAEDLNDLLPVEFVVAKITLLIKEITRNHGFCYR